jgi:hypothetical protein
MVAVSAEQLFDRESVRILRAPNHSTTTDEESKPTIPDAQPLWILPEGYVPPTVSQVPQGQATIPEKQLPDVLIPETITTQPVSSTDASKQPAKETATE